MTEQNCDQKNNSITNLKMLPEEELESKVDSLLAKCRAEVDIKNTRERGAMFRKGPFQITISLAVKIKQYQDELLYCRRNPYDVLFSVCKDNGWSAPEFRTVDYVPGEGFLFSVIVNDHELVSKWRNRRLLLAADLASANFLRYLGLWVDVRNLNLIFEWDQITNEDTGAQKKEAVDLNGYLYFMGFRVEKAIAELVNNDEHSTSNSNLINLLSLRPNIHLQLTKLMYVFLVSRGEKPRWLTEMDLAFFKRIFGNLEPNESYAFNTESYKPEVVCSCSKKRSKICFDHDKFFFYSMLKDYYYVDKFGPVDLEVFERLKKMKKEEGDVERNDNKEMKKESERSECKFKSSCSLLNPVNFDPSETPLNLKEKKFDLRSKILTKVKVEDLFEKDFEICFDNSTGLSNIKSIEGNWISLADICPPAARGSKKRPCSSITVVTSECEKRRKK